MFVEEKDDIRFLYRTIHLLTAPIPYGVREELYTELLLRGIKLLDRPHPYVFVSLRNLRRDFLRSKRVKEPSALAEEIHDDFELVEVESNFHGDKLVIIYDTFFTINTNKRYFVEEIVWSLFKVGFFSVRDCAKKCGMSPTRGHEIFQEFKEKVTDAKNQERKPRGFRLNDIGDLFRLLFPDGRRGRRPRMPKG